MDHELKQTQAKIRGHLAEAKKGLRAFENSYLLLQTLLDYMCYRERDRDRALTQGGCHDPHPFTLVVSCLEYRIRA
jgi:hypothetical protein